MDYKKIHQYLTLHQRRAQLKEELKGLTNEMEPIEEEILTEFQEDEIDHLSIGGFKLYVHEDISATILTPKEDITIFHKAIRRAKLGYMIKESINAQTLKAYIRERRSQDQPLPKSIEPLLDILPVYSIKINSA